MEDRLEDIRRVLKQQFDLEIELKHREIYAIKHELDRTKFLTECLQYVLKTKEFPRELCPGKQGSISNLVVTHDFIDFNEILLYRTGPTDFVQLACPICKQTKFKSMLVFLQHCRGEHQLTFPTQDECAHRCGTKIEAKLIPSWHSIWQSYVSQPVEQESKLKPEIQIFEEMIDEQDFEMPRLVDLPVLNLAEDEISSNSSSDDDAESPNNITKFISYFPDEKDAKGTRYHISRELIVGNTWSQVNDPQNPFRWTAYLKEKKGGDELSSFIRKVRFFLHPEYPDSIVDVRNPPFEITRNGRGVSPVRLQVFFRDPRNLPVNVIHVLGVGGKQRKYERNFEIELDKETIFEVNVEDLEDNDTPNQDDGSNLEKTRISKIKSHFVKNREKTEEFSKEIVSWLEQTITKFPIIRQENDTKLPYHTAASLSEYMGWPLGKRKAVEYLRARLVNKYLNSHHEITVSNKTMVVWLRENGYTPSSIANITGDAFCKGCGGFWWRGHCESKTLFSYTSRDDIIEKITQKREEVKEYNFEDVPCVESILLINAVLGEIKIKEMESEAKAVLSLVCLMLNIGRESIHGEDFGLCSK